MDNTPDTVEKPPLEAPTGRWAWVTLVVRRLGLPPHTATVAMLAAVYYLLLQWSFPSLAEFDAYYHVGVSQLYLDEGFVRKFPWMTITFLRDRFNDPQFLLHLLTMPWLAIGVDGIVAGKLVAALTATLLAVVLHWFLCRRAVRWPVVWTLVWLVVSPYTVARLTFVKTTALFIAVILLFLDAMFERRRWRLFVLGAVAVYTYQGFPLLLVLVAAWAGARAIWAGESFDVKSLRATLWGILVGLVVNPFFPNDLYFFHFEIVQQILMKPKEVAMGAEWMPVDTVRFAGSMGLCLLLLAGSGLASSLARVKLDGRQLFIRCLAYLLFLGALTSARLMEYFAPFAVVAAAMAVTAVMEQPGAAFRPGMRAIWGALLFIGIPAAVLNVKDGVRTSKSLAAQIDSDGYRRVAEFLEKNTTEGSVVVSHWDDFPMLFMFNSKNHYLFGLSPSYAYGHDPRLYMVHSMFFEGRIQDPESFVRQVGSRHVVLARAESYPGRRALVESLTRSPWFDEVMSEGAFRVFALRDTAKLRPPVAPTTGQ